MCLLREFKEDGGHMVLNPSDLLWNRVSQCMQPTRYS